MKAASRSIAALLSVGLIAGLVMNASGCGLFVDGIYVVSPKKFETREEVREPVKAVDTFRTLSLAPDDLSVSCAVHETSLLRQYAVLRSFERQNGYDRGSYAGLMFADAAIGGVLAGVLGWGCTRGFAHDGQPDEPPTMVPCESLAAAAPFGADFVYSLARFLTVRPRRLVDKQALPATLVRSDVELRATPIACPPTTTITVSAPPTELRLVAGETGRPSPEESAHARAVLSASPDATVTVDSGGISGWEAPPPARRAFGHPWVPPPPGAR